MKKMQLMLHDLKMKISRVESWHATLITWSLGFRILKIRDSGPLRNRESENWRP